MAHTPRDSVALAPPAAAGSLTADVAAVVGDYLGTLQRKDEDIFRLYEDNKRLRDLYEGREHRAEELEAELRAQRLLAASQATELREQRLLLEAQAQEAAATTAALADMRLLLGRPSELDSDPAELAADVGMLLEERDRLAAETGDYMWCVREWHGWTSRFVADCEARERNLLAAAADDSLAVFEAARQLTSSAGVGLEALTRRAEESALEAQTAELQRQRAEREAAEARNLQREATTTLAEQQTAVAQLQEILRLQLEEAEARRQMQTTANEELYAALLPASQAAYRDSCQRERALLETVSTLRRECQELHARARETAQTHRVQMEEITRRLTLARAEGEEHRRRLLACMDAAQRERAQGKSRQQTLEQQLAAGQAAIEKLSRQHEAATTTAEALRVERTQLQKNLGAAQAKAERLKAAETERDKTASQLQCSQEEAQRLRHEVELLSRKLSELGAEHEAARTAQEAAHTMAEAARAELREWVASAEAARAEAAELRGRLSREQAAREVLEAQQREDASVAARMLALSEQLMAEREAAAAEAQGRAALVRQVQILEEACRGSAAVIADLREALQHARAGDSDGRASGAALLCTGRDRPTYAYFRSLSQNETRNRRGEGHECAVAGPAPDAAISSPLRSAADPRTPQRRSTHSRAVDSGIAQAVVLQDMLRYGSAIADGETPWSIEKGTPAPRTSTIGWTPTPTVSWRTDTIDANADDAHRNATSANKENM